ncbi:hypothetical protein GWI33_015890 [Rhynchophorus ferrugineus]|uniref:Chitin binding peritrophin-a domain n=2 Tax=Rhynchophorus ferrugineus TaxID=354439 RepID=A0A650DLE0_RHYFE|nr:hypothetical protein GWI33_015890 [Rhynchophorus ferrugineus]QGT33342.1 chitin binding peritrophin-a domain [Rhynchophorus ferrugineus]
MIKVGLLVFAICCCYLVRANIECPEVDGGSPTYIADPDDCSAFYECSNGEPWRIVCAPGALFDANSLKCENEEDVNCGTRPNPGSRSTPSSRK